MWNRETSAERLDQQRASPEPLAGRVKAATVSRSVCITGTLSGAEDLMVDGHLEGRIELPGYALTIGPNANLKADIIASIVTIFGRVAGHVTARDKAEIRRGGSLQGDLTTGSIAIQEGALFCGKLEMERRTDGAQP